VGNGRTLCVFARWGALGGGKVKSYDVESLVVLESGNARRGYVHGWGEFINGGNCELAGSGHGVEGDDKASVNRHIAWGLQVHVRKEEKQYVTLEGNSFRLFG
jgi:hypothetical protein